MSQSEIVAGAGKKPVPGLRKQVIAKSGWVFAARISIALSNIVINAILTRLLSPDEVGTYFLTFSLVSVATLVAQLGLCQTVVKMVAESLALNNSARARATIKSVFWYGTFGSLAVGAILSFGLGQWLAYNVFHSALMAGIVQIAVFWIILLTYQNLMAESFRSFYDIRNASIYGGMATSIITTGLFALLCIFKVRVDLAKVLILTIIAISISLIIAGFLLYKKVRRLEPKGRVSRNEIFTITVPMLINSVTAFIFTQADIWVLGANRPQSEVAIYGAAFRLVTMINLPLIIINGVVPPLIAQLYTQGKKKELESLLRAAATLASIASIAAFCGYLLAGKPFLQLVYGKYYGNGEMILWILSIGQIISVMCGSCGFTLLMTGHQNTIVWITISTDILIITAALLLVKPFGMLGVAAAASMAAASQNLISLYYVKKLTGMWTYAQFSLDPVKKFLKRMRGK